MESQVRAHRPNFTVVALKCGVTVPKIAESNFWFKFAQKGESWGHIETISAQLQTFLYATAP